MKLLKVCVSAGMLSLKSPILIISEEYKPKNDFFMEEISLHSKVYFLPDLQKDHDLSPSRDNVDLLKYKKVRNKKNKEIKKNIKILA
jgi:hypothetical protein